MENLEIFKNMKQILFLMNFIFEKGYYKDNKIIEYIQEKNFMEKIVFKFITSFNGI